jgi:hypothetical protein
MNFITGEIKQVLRLCPDASRFYQDGIEKRENPYGPIRYRKILVSLYLVDVRL